MAYEYDRFEREDGGGAFLMGLLAGTVLGAGLGMLFAPKAGNELRNQLGESASRLRGASSDIYSQASEKVTNIVDRGREAYERARGVASLMSSPTATSTGGASASSGAGTTAGAGFGSTGGSYGGGAGETGRDTFGGSSIGSGTIGRSNEEVRGAGTTGRPADETRGTGATGTGVRRPGDETRGAGSTGGTTSGTGTTGSNFGGSNPGGNRNT